MAQTTFTRRLGPFLSSSGCGDTESDAFLGTAVLTLRANLHKSFQSPTHVTMLFNFALRNSNMVRLSSTTTNDYPPLRSTLWVDLESPRLLNVELRCSTFNIH
jgi:hypothetical protein